MADSGAGDVTVIIHPNSSPSSPESPGGKQSDHDVHEGVRFNPPVYKQRYAAVLQIAKKNGVESVVDFGCAECKLVLMLKSMFSLRKLTGVDIDHALLESYSNIAKPLTYEFMCRPRHVPFNVTLMSGDVAQCDSRLEGYDMVSAVEIIEHLLPQTLKHFPQTIFGYIRPRIAVITTPNSELNPSLGLAPGTFRHWDHKFEWTRSEFHDWCQTQCDLYGYTVQHSCIGFLSDQGQKSRDLIGGCSQMAVFTRSHVLPNQPIVKSDGEVYRIAFQILHTPVTVIGNLVPSPVGSKWVKLFNEVVVCSVTDVSYPYESRSLAERVRSEVQYSVTQLSRDTQRDVESTGIPVKMQIPLNELLHFQLVDDLVSGSVELLQNALEESEYDIETESGQPVIVHWVKPYERSDDDEESDEQFLVTTLNDVQISC